MDTTPDYELIDAGEGGRLERFAGVVVDRPAPGALAPRRDLGAWRRADLRFDRATGWSGTDPGAGWELRVGAARMGLRTTPAGGLGVFPEHLANTAWVDAQVRARLVPGVTADARVAPTVLHLFGHTGLLTLVAAAAGASVSHVDASRPAVAWARGNAARSGLADRPVRWIVDDALAFLTREARRGRRYDGIVLDPPSHGHAGGRSWHLEDQLDPLLVACRAVAAPGAFVLLSAHTQGFDGDALAARLAAAFRVRAGTVEGRPMTISATSGATLHLGAVARLATRA